MQVWPRVRAKRIYKRVKKFPQVKEAKLLSFAGYKAGMTHVLITDARKYSMTKGEDITWPVTIIECPPIRIAGVRFYKIFEKAMRPAFDILAKADKELGRKIDVPKKETKKLDTVKAEDFDELRMLIETQPKMTGIGKKMPEFFEGSVGGNKDEKFKFAKDNLGKELSVKDVFKEGQMIDIHAVTKGKGFQGPVKRFGVKIRNHKAEKTKRGPGSLGGWSAQGHVMYRVAHAGQMGYHNRIDYNKQILMIGDDAEQVKIKGGLKNYGVVKNTYVLVKGSVPGPEKRIIRLEAGRKVNNKVEQVPPTIQYISTASKQGN
jgi:large subunit ribosomal protein L3